VILSTVGTCADNAAAESFLGLLKRAEHRGHVWSYDFVFDRTHDDRPLRMLTIVDVFIESRLTSG
jgi:transposase InsO family protein